MSFKIGLVINPLAGIGGPLALKGSDGSDIVQTALQRGAQCLANQRAQVALQHLLPFKHHLQWFSARGVMGQNALSAVGFSSKVVGQLAPSHTTAEDTKHCASALINLGVDLLLFVGGDGTARNIADVISADSNQLVLGIPAGVKMHSGVYAVSPQAAARVIQQFLLQKPVSIAHQEVRDIDEVALRAGHINAQYYGELLVPNDDRYVQQIKNSGVVDDSVFQADIAAGVVDIMDNNTIYIIGAGTTLQAIMDELVLPNTLLGVDVILNKKILASDVSSAKLMAITEQYKQYAFQVIITPTGGQGHIIGRGNQQLSAGFLKKLGKQHIMVLITPNKLSALEGRPLFMDSGDQTLDKEWSGWITIITGYHTMSRYPLSSGDSD